MILFFLLDKKIYESNRIIKVIMSDFITRLFLVSICGCIGLQGIIALIMDPPVQDSNWDDETGNYSPIQLEWEDINRY